MSDASLLLLFLYSLCFMISYAYMSSILPIPVWIKLFWVSCALMNSYPLSIAFISRSPSVISFGERTVLVFFAVWLGFLRWKLFFAIVDFGMLGGFKLLMLFVCDALIFVFVVIDIYVLELDGRAFFTPRSEAAYFPFNSSADISDCLDWHSLIPLGLEIIWYWWLKISSVAPSW